MEAKPILRPTTLANLRRGTHDLEVSLRVRRGFTRYLAPDLRYSLLASEDGEHVRLRTYEKHRYGHRHKCNYDAEGRARAQILRAAATAFLDYTSPQAADENYDGMPWPYDSASYNRDPFLPRFFDWVEAESGSYFRSFEPSFETKRSLVEAGPILIRGLESYFTVEYAVATKRSRLLFPTSD
jgi:hypothetical protein